MKTMATKCVLLVALLGFGQVSAAACESGLVMLSHEEMGVEVTKLVCADELQTASAEEAPKMAEPETSERIQDSGFSEPQAQEEPQQDVQIHDQSIIASQEESALIVNESKPAFRWRNINSPKSFNKAVAAQLKSKKGVSTKRALVARMLDQHLDDARLSQDEKTFVTPVLYGRLLEQFGLATNEEVQASDALASQMASEGKLHFTYHQQGKRYSLMVSAPGDVQENVEVAVKPYTVTTDFNRGEKTDSIPVIEFYPPMVGDVRKIIGWVPECGNISIEIRRVTKKPVVPTHPGKETVHKEPPVTVTPQQLFAIKAVYGVYGYAGFGAVYGYHGGGGGAAIMFPVEDNFLWNNERLWLGPGFDARIGGGEAANGNWADMQYGIGPKLRADVAGRIGDINHNLAVEVGGLFNWVNAGNPNGSVTYKQDYRSAFIYGEGIFSEVDSPFYWGVQSRAEVMLGGSKAEASWGNAKPNDMSQYAVNAVFGYRFDKYWSFRFLPGWNGQWDGDMFRNGAQLVAQICYQTDEWGKESIMIGCLGGGAQIGLGVTPVVGGALFAGNVMEFAIDNAIEDGVQAKGPVPKSTVEQFKPSNDLLPPVVTPPQPVTIGRDVDFVY